MLGSHRTEGKVRGKEKKGGGTRTEESRKWDGGPSGEVEEIETLIPCAHCHGDIRQGRLARTYASREGDMSW